MSYIIVEVDSGGYVKTITPGHGNRVIHKETKGMLHYLPCQNLLDDAIDLLRRFVSRRDYCILGLTEDGGGKELWMTDEQRELIEPRLNKWRGCYGGWPIRRLNSL